MAKRDEEALSVLCERTTLVPERRLGVLCRVRRGAGRRNRLSLRRCRRHTDADHTGICEFELPPCQHCSAEKDDSDCFVQTRERR